MPLLRVDQDGLWCEAGGFYIDPWNPVPKALITHGHSDHARPGSGAYLCAAPSVPILQLRLGPEARIETLPYGERLPIGDVAVSFHPAGHVLGSAQIRVEHRGEVWVVSGDYKLSPDPTCTPFEPVRCHTFVTESTFGLPIYRWPSESAVFASINDWWRSNQEKRQCSVIFAYPLGKSQRLLAGLDPATGPIFCHGAIQRMNRVYRETGVALPETEYTGGVGRGYYWGNSMVIAPPSAQGSTWLRRFGALSTGMASGWMRIRGKRRHRPMDRGFVLSDHADWPELRQAIAATEAECILVTHGYRAPMVRWLEEQGKQARALETRFEGEGGETEEPLTEDAE
ncbi:MAG: ligase-associated DNA damage response exonuclease [Acidobacteriota bacterium]